VTSLLTQIASGLCWIIYGSFFEWYWHKLWMHTPRPPKEAFRGHTIVHHGLYKGDQSYFVPEGQHPEHILLKPYALPAIVIAHLPVVFLIEHFVHHTAIGGITATILYFLVYEYMHWNMHVPRKQFVERFRWFQFLRSHHHLHHRYFQKNFCVLLPLADVCLGTFATEQSMARKRAEREKAIAGGQVALERTKKRRADREREGASPLSQRFSRFKTQRVRASRNRRVQEVREMLDTVKTPRDR
jgi:sterol desaturase/sphingolipid hydroxylase (fatty acid hydroxylase superfamily)